MNIVKEFKETYKEIPREVKRFLKRALLIFVIWKLLYGFFLYPSRFPDKQLTHLISAGTEQILSKIYPDMNFMVGETCELDSDKQFFCYDYVMMGHQKIIVIADGCNGLELIALYAGFLFCIPAAIGKMTAYTILGIAMIGICNILRCAGLAWMNFHHYTLTGLAHHYVFKVVIYGLIFGVWIFYSRGSINTSDE